MARRCVVVVLGACALLPAGAQARSGAQALADRALQQTLREPGCDAPALTETTDASPPAAVLRRYGIFRTPQPADTGIVPVVFDGQGGRVPRGYLRTRVVGGVDVTVTPLLDWRPSVWPERCDARLLTVARGMAEGRSPDVRRATERAAKRIIASNNASRKLPPRTLLSLGVPGGIAVTGALPLSARIGLFTRVTAEPSRASTTFAGLVPDGITKLTARAAPGAMVTATVRDNLVVLRLRHGSTPRRYDVLDTSRSTPRHLRYLVAG